MAENKPKATSVNFKSTQVKRPLKHKGFYALLLTALLGMFLFVSYYATQQTQVYESSATLSECNSIGEKCCKILSLYTCSGSSFLKCSSQSSSGVCKSTLPVPCNRRNTSNLCNNLTNPKCHWCSGQTTGSNCVPSNTLCKPKPSSSECKSTADCAKIGRGYCSGGKCLGCNVITCLNLGKVCSNGNCVKTTESNFTCNKAGNKCCTVQVPQIGPIGPHKRSFCILPLICGSNGKCKSNTGGSDNGVPVPNQNVCSGLNKTKCAQKSAQCQFKNGQCRRKVGGKTCTKDKNCNNNQSCKNGKCVNDNKCKKDKDCKKNQSCGKNGKCVKDNKCKKDKDCNKKQICNKKGKCVDKGKGGNECKDSGGACRAAASGCKIGEIENAGLVCGGANTGKVCCEADTPICPDGVTVPDESGLCLCTDGSEMPGDGICPIIIDPCPDLSEPVDGECLCEDSSVMPPDGICLIEEPPIEEPPIECAAGETLDEATGECLPPGECPAGEVFDEATQECVGGETGTATIALSMKFQGITGETLSGISTLDVRVRLRSDVLDEDLETTTTVTNDGSGVWTGEAEFDGAVSDGNYTLLVKGPMHLQKKVCDAIPTESTPGTYNCGDGNIKVDVTTTNTVDMSGIVFLAGDLSPQDGVVDSYDISLVRNGLCTTDNPDICKDGSLLSQADVNLDGIIDTQDHSLLISALSFKYDDE